MNKLIMITELTILKIISINNSSKIQIIKNMYCRFQRIISKNI